MGAGHTNASQRYITHTVTQIQDNENKQEQGIEADWVCTQVKVSADSAGTLELELILELFDASAKFVNLLDGDLRTQTAQVTSNLRRV